MVAPWCRGRACHSTAGPCEMTPWHARTHTLTHSLTHSLTLSHTLSNSHTSIPSRERKRDTCRTHIRLLHTCHIGQQRNPSRRPRTTSFLRENRGRKHDAHRVPHSVQPCGSADGDGIRCPRLFGDFRLSQASRVAGCPRTHAPSLCGEAGPRAAVREWDGAALCSGSKNLGACARTEHVQVREAHA